MELLEFSFIQYVFQCILHSFIIAFVVEVLLKIWHEERPLLRLRFRLLVIVIPVISFPLYQLIYPRRGSFGFRRSLAIFDINQWLLLRLGNGILVWHVALVLLGVVTTVFLVQEAIPILLAYFRQEASKTLYKSGAIPKLDIILEGLKKRSSFVAEPRIFLLAEKEPVIYIDGIRKSSINISRSLLAVLDEEELEGAIAHELAHIMRRDNAISLVLFPFRFIMFYNPVTLVQIRSIIQEREKLCDDMASSLTGKPLALASSLIKVFRISSAIEFTLPPKSSLRNRILSIAHNLESHSHRVRMKSRIKRIVHPKKSYNPPYPYVRLVITTLSLILLLFFVV
jgi:Zn-dependent protease with chaperone function